MTTPTQDAARTGEVAYPDEIVYTHGHELKVWEYQSWAGRKVATRPISVFEMPEVARRYNSHAALVEALDAIWPALRNWHELHPEQFDDLDRRAIAAWSHARAALALAKGGQQ